MAAFVEVVGAGLGIAAGIAGGESEDIAAEQRSLLLPEGGRHLLDGTVGAALRLFVGMVETVPQTGQKGHARDGAADFTEAANAAAETERGPAGEVTRHTEPLAQREDDGLGTGVAGEEQGLGAVRRGWGCAHGAKSTSRAAAGQGAGATRRYSSGVSRFSRRHWSMVRPVAFLKR